MTSELINKSSAFNILVVDDELRPSGGDSRLARRRAGGADDKAALGDRHQDRRRGMDSFATRGKAPGEDRREDKPEGDLAVQGYNNAPDLKWLKTIWGRRRHRS